MACFLQMYPETTIIITLLAAKAHIACDTWVCFCTTRGPCKAQRNFVCFFTFLQNIANRGLAHMPIYNHSMGMSVLLALKK